MRPWTQLVPLLLLFGCSYSASVLGVEPDARLDEPFTLAPGQQVRVEGTPLEIGFLRVRSDSRCPVDVQCVWAGDAAVEVETVAAGASRTHVLHTTDDPRFGSRVAERDGYRIELVGLAPDSHSERPIAAADYRATLEVTRVD